ncbi:extra-cytoplasmic solute receptor family protein 140 [Achromobacter xylosoxidans A8]|uniref:Extra-cytoplasmic solute receptor family protein 140 n=1 Tax=Achromobacter xylosoxidans (strain A8) TaxID=762376 RepID=E3HRH8_ACHXA|nr:tripartite tricarboxylate transporter substrate binding protein [Achromobacter xylosoxidans]ADP18456.1 extra-cytoplasmic solute receptor family protein 140 [Achromobacter xylosoxidans A8]
MSRIISKSIAALAMAGLLAGAGSAGAAYPEKPLRVVVPYTAGGVSDAVARLVTRKLSDEIGQPIVVENLGGANGQIGSAAVARSAPDGYTFLVVVMAHAINPSLYKNMTYDPLRDLRGISLFGRIPLLLVSSARLPPRNLEEFLAWARANPDSATFASSGAGSGAHLAAEEFAQVNSLRITHVPYKGVGPALPDLYSGQVAAIFDSVQTMMPQVKAGKLRALAMTSASRWPGAPDVPTMAEAGVPDFVVGSWIGMLAPAKVPDERAEQISAAVQRVLDQPDVRAQLIGYGIDPVGGKPAAFDSFIADEAGRWADVIAKAGIRLE